MPIQAYFGIFLHYYILHLLSPALDPAFIGRHLFPQHSKGMLPFTIETETIILKGRPQSRNATAGACLSSEPFFARVSQISKRTSSHTTRCRNASVLLLPSSFGLLCYSYKFSSSPVSLGLFKSSET